MRRLIRQSVVGAPGVCVVGAPGVCVRVRLHTSLSLSQLATSSPTLMFRLSIAPYSRSLSEPSTLALFSGPWSSSLPMSPRGPVT